MNITAVIPVKNKADVLARCLESIRVAAAARPDTRVILVDNGSTDGSLEVQERYRESVTLLRSTATRIGAVRNDGAREAPAADILAFIDCDCVVPADFFLVAEHVFGNAEITAAGCEVLSPKDGHWTEVAWDKLHRPIGDGYRHYINSACFLVRTDSFNRVGGFDESKISSEDVDICWRLRAQGAVLWQSESLAVIHLGNPKSVAGVYSRLRWHSEGIYEPGKGVQWSVSTIAALLHGASVLAGAAMGALLLVRGYWWGVLVLIASVLVVPVGFVMARAVQHRRAVPIVGGIGLMLITFPARIHGMLKSIFGTARN